MYKSIYDLKGMKGKNSIFKSVFVTNRNTYEGFPIVEVEAYDRTFLNATNTESKYDKTVLRIAEKVLDYFNGKDVWMAIYTDKFGTHEILLNEKWIERYKNL